MKNKIMTMAMMALAFTACTEEDLMQPTNVDAGTLRIASVTIDGQEVARTRVVADGVTYDDSYPFNQSYNGFTAGNRLMLVTNGLSAEGVITNQFYAIYNNDGTWTISANEAGTTPVSLKPTDTWADANISAAFGGDDVKGSIAEAYDNVAPYLDVVQGDISVNSSIIYRDWLVASTGNGVTIDTDVKSPTLGVTTIVLKHARALLRLPQSAANVSSGTYIVNGTAHNVTDLGTLWAVLNMSSTSEDEDGTETTTPITIYCPLTEVGDYLQAIVPASTVSDEYTLTGFKAVVLTEESGAVDSESFDETKTLTLDLPFKVGEETTASAGIALQPNYRYPLTLNIAPHTANVALSNEMGKPGWGTDEDELSNEMNDNPYILGSATSVDEVKSILEACIVAGKTTITVKGETLEAYSGDTDNAQTVVGEAIRQLTLDSDGSPDPTSSNIGTISLELPNVTSIGDKAFYNCDALTSVSLPAVTSIGEQAFKDCTKLTSLTFVEVIESVGSDAFLGTLSDENDWTTRCALTLNSSQQNSEGNLKASGNTWADKTWASISYVNEGVAVEGN